MKNRLVATEYFKAQRRGAGLYVRMHTEWRPLWTSR